MHPARRTGAALALLALGALAGCAEGGGLAAGLRSAGVTSTPDEFLVLPTRPLEMPPDLTTLPPPIPGSLNRVDIRPRAEAVAGLTGSTGPAGAAAAPALVARAGPVDPQVRVTLAREDAAFRRDNRPRILERVFSRDQDPLIYRRMTLDARAEFERLRALGLRVPPAPPAAEAE